MAQRRTSKRVDPRAFLLRALLLLGVLFVGLDVGVDVDVDGAAPRAWWRAPQAYAAPLEAPLAPLELQRSLSVPGERGPSCERLVRPLGDDEAQRGLYEGAEVQRLTPGRRAPAHVERWLKHAVALCGRGGCSAPAFNASPSLADSAAPRGTERHSNIDRAQAEADAHAPRGPPSAQRA